MRERQIGIARGGGSVRDGKARGRGARKGSPEGSERASGHASGCSASLARAADAEACGAAASALLALGSDDWMSLRDAVGRVGHLLRSGQLADPERAALGERLRPLASHPMWEVRQEVAHAILHLRHEAFSPMLAQLLADDSVWVVEAAKRTRARRTELDRCDLLKEHHEKQLQRYLGDLEARYDGRARAAALRVAEKYAEMMVRELCHEVNGVISAIRKAHEDLQVALGRVRLDPAVCQEHLGTARETLSILVTTLDSVRDLMCEAPAKFQGESLRAIVEEAAGLVQDQAGNRGVAIALEVDPAIRLDAHRHQLRQALRNLVQNAVDAYRGLDRPRQVRVAARVEKGAQVVLTVRDQGCGMDEEQKDEALELFATHKPGGTGYGLKLAKKIVEREHRGQLHLESQPNVGTTVVLTLPLEQREREDLS